MNAIEALEERIRLLEDELKQLVEARSSGRILLMAEIIDEEGRTRAMWATGHGGTVSLNLLDQHSRLRAALGQTKTGPAVFLLDDAGNRRVDLHLEADGSPQLVLADGEGRTRIDGFVDAAGLPTMGLLDQNGAPAAALLVTKEGKGAAAARAR